jgi:hypothetical protein
MRLAAVQCAGNGFFVNCERIMTAYRMSGRVACAAYISDPIRVAYANDPL